MGDRTFNYSAGVTDGESRRVTSRPDIIKARLFAAVDSVLLADGTIDCRYNQLGAGPTLMMYFKILTCNQAVQLIHLTFY